MNATQSNGAETRTKTLVGRGFWAALLFSIALSAPGRAHAQFHGQAATYGSEMGMSIFDQELMKFQIAYLNASQIQLFEAQAEQAYWSAVLAREQALSLALANSDRIKARQSRPERTRSSGVAAPRRRGGRVPNPVAGGAVIVARARP